MPAHGEADKICPHALGCQNWPSIGTCGTHADGQIECDRGMPQNRSLTLYATRYACALWATLHVDHPRSRQTCQCQVVHYSSNNHATAVKAPSQGQLGAGTASSSSWLAAHSDPMPKNQGGKKKRGNGHEGLSRRNHRMVGCGPLGRQAPELASSCHMRSFTGLDEKNNGLLAEDGA